MDTEGSRYPRPRIQWDLEWRWARPGIQEGQQDMREEQVEVSDVEGAVAVEDLEEARGPKRRTSRGTKEIGIVQSEDASRLPYYATATACSWGGRGSDKG